MVVNQQMSNSRFGLLMSIYWVRCNSAQSRHSIKTSWIATSFV